MSTVPYSPRSALCQNDAFEGDDVALEEVVGQVEKDSELAVLSLHPQVAVEHAQAAREDFPESPGAWRDCAEGGPLRTCAR